MLVFLILKNTRPDDDDMYCQRQVLPVTTDVMALITLSNNDSLLFFCGGDGNTMQ